jgi:hypothetical protein
VRYTQNKEVVARQIEGETVIVPIRRGVGDMNSVYTLNPVGTVLWHFMAKSRSVPEMVQRICSEFEVTPGQALGDVEVFVSSLLEEKLIQGRTETEQAESSRGLEEAEKKESIVASSHLR